MSTSQWFTLFKPFNTRRMQEHEKVSPKVRHDVQAEHLRESRVVRPGRESTKPDKDTNVRANDLTMLMGRKQHGIGIEIWDRMLSLISQYQEGINPRTAGAEWVALLTGRIADQIHDPADKLRRN